MFGKRATALSLQRASVTIIAAFCSLTLGACASASYKGISFRQGGAETWLQNLAKRAQAGEKEAQLELGIRYEEGRGVPIDIDRARKLYSLAASASDGVKWIYSAPVRDGQSGRMIPVSSGRPQAGLEEARVRLSRLTSER